MSHPCSISLFATHRQKVSIDDKCQEYELSFRERANDLMATKSNPFAGTNDNPPR
jgi:hypothetical protein